MRLAGARTATSYREISSGAPRTPSIPATLCTRPASLCAQAAAPSIHVITCYQPATRYVEHADGFWRSEKDVAEDGQAVGLQQPVGLQQRASPTAEAPEAGTPEAATGDRGAAAAAAAAGAGGAAATMIEEVRAPPLYS